MTLASVNGNNTLSEADKKEVDRYMNFTVHDPRPETPNLTDLGNGQRFALLHGPKVRFCFPWNKWLIWNDTRWEIDNTGKISRFAVLTIRHIYKEASEVDGEKQRKDLANHGIRSESDGKIQAMVNQAKSQPDLQFLPEHLDKDPWLLNCVNGTVNLHTGELQKHDPNDLITKVCPVFYNPDAKAPIWEACLKTWTNDNQELIDFLQRAVGYSLTGHNGEECIFLPWGPGRNGKSRFLGAIQHCMGDYAKSSSPETFMVKKEASISNDLASLQGVRFVPTIETEEGHRIAEALMKWITGNDVLKVRFLYQEYFEYHPQFKLWLASNHKPEIRGTDNAIWERIFLIPFEVYIPVEKRDKDLEKKLELEATGILSWAVKGCLEWQRIGLKPPEKIVLATKNYRMEMDKTASWIEDCCIIEPESRSKNKELYESYSAWCLKEGEKPLYIGTFAKRLEEKGFTAFRNTREKGRCGIRLRTASELESFYDGSEPSLEPSYGTVIAKPDGLNIEGYDGYDGSAPILRAREGVGGEVTGNDGSNRHSTSQDERMRALPRALEDGPKSHVELRLRLRDLGVETTPEEFSEMIKRAEVDNIILFRDEKVELM